MTASERVAAHLTRARLGRGLSFGVWHGLRFSWPFGLLLAVALAGPGQASAQSPLPPAPPPPPALWFDASGQPNASARIALQLLADAAADGLVAEDYQARELTLRADALAQLPEPPEAALQAFEHDLGTALQRYLHDLHLGRVDPHALGFRVKLTEAHREAPPPDFAALLQTAVATQRLPQTVASLRPRISLYGKLREALARYRVLAAEAPPGPLPDFRPARSVKPGQAYAGAPALRHLLRALGDLPPATANTATHATPTPPENEVYDAPLAEGVKRFQARHGLDADGALGRATLAALNVPLAQRVLQLELALERLRWLPDLSGQAFVGINIPMFHLWAWDPAMPQQPLLDMGVVVGRALDTQTPVLMEHMRHLIFRPYWNVPRSIVREELLPTLLRDPGYLLRHDMEVVRGESDNAEPVEASPDNLELLRLGALRLRQRPGPKNALGRVKFIFPNDDNVYLHDTPATQLFGRARRDFSHGCVRVEQPLALAAWVLRQQPEWTRGRIEAAMAGSTSQRVELARPVPVILFYVTAMVMPSDLTLRFAPDIYGHDERLARALAKRRAGF